MKFNIRRLEESDYETLVDWWKWWRWTAPPKTFLPDTGFIVEKDSIGIVACYVYMTNSKAALMEWVVSNPQYRNKDRKEAIKFLMQVVEKLLKDRGIIHLMTMGRHPSLLKIHKELGWSIDPTPSHEIIKNI
jgi:hypothetical protein